MDIAQKTVWVAGGASGLGAATAAHLATLGAKPVVIDIQAPKADYPHCTLDLAQLDIDAPIASLIAAHGRPSVLVNCAGVANAGRVVGREGPLPIADFARVIQINLMGSFNLLRLAAAAMIDNQSGATDERGVIINTASVAAFEGQLGQAAYSASKGGVAAMTLPIAREMAQHQIRVVTVAPGVFDTPMMQGMTDAVRQSLEQTVPYPSRLGDPMEYATFVQHIIENPYMNGAVYRLDGALRMQ